jgi:uncharacterized membrane protein
MKKWKCLVCGYVHEGDEPPEKCPVCGAPKEKFEEVVVEGEDKAEKEVVSDASKGGLFGLVFGLMVENKAHPIAVHFPNGILPVTVLFLLMSFVFDAVGFEKASFYNLVVVALAMPVVLFSGAVDWQMKYGGELTSIFKMKIAMGLIVTLICWVLAIWGFVNPEVMTSTALDRYIYLACHFAALGAAGFAGHLGGKLVFD